MEHVLQFLARIVSPHPTRGLGTHKPLHHRHDPISKHLEERPFSETDHSQHRSDPAADVLRARYPLELCGEILNEDAVDYAGGLDGAVSGLAESS